MIIIINNYSKPVYILFDYDDAIVNHKFNEKILQPDSIVCILSSWYKSQIFFEIIRTNPNYNIVILANTLEEKSFYENEPNCDVIFCNHNAFLNENVYKIDNLVEQKYDLVVDSAFHEYKNRKIAKKIKNILHIGYMDRNSKHSVVIPDYGVLPNFIDGKYERITKNKIYEYYNQCLIGGIFSECEGACFASSQYLLCGLPVLSIKSVGGRDIWYNKDNSIICENNDDSVYENVERAKEKIANGEFDRVKIRNLHLKQMDEHRNTLIEYLNKKLLNFNETVDVNDIKKQFAVFMHW